MSKYVYIVSRGEDANDLSSVILRVFANHIEAEVWVKSVIKGDYHEIEKFDDDPKSLIDGRIDEKGDIYFIQQFEIT